MRAFVAIDLPDTARDALAAVQAEVRVGRKVPWEALHLTLAFLDDHPESTLRALHDGLAEIARAPFDITLGGLEVLGGKTPRVLYIRAEGGDALDGLHRSVRRVARDVGIDLPRERFRPHVTLARFRRDMSEEGAAKLGGFLARYGAASGGSALVTQFCLYESSLHPDGATHEVLAEYPLDAG